MTDKDEPAVERYTIYFAGPLFSNAERAWNRKLRDYLLDKGNFEIFLPQEACQGVNDSKETFSICKKALDESQIVMAILDGPDADSGTSWEVGYANGRGKQVLGVRTDFRKCEIHNVNIMLHYAVDILVQDFSGVDDTVFRKVLEGVRTLLLKSDAKAVSSNVLR